MKIVSRVVLLLVAAVLVVTLGAPPVIGIWTEHLLQNTVQTLNTKQSAAKISIADHHFGWFQSDTTVQIASHYDPKQPPFSIKLSIHHGPLIMVHHAQHTEKKWAFAGITLANPSPVALQWILHFNGDQTLAATLPHLAHQHEGLSLSIDQLKASGHSQSDTKQVAFAIQANAVALDPLVSLKNITYHATLQNQQHLLVGKQSFTLGDFIINDHQKQLARLRNLSVNSATQLVNKTVETHVDTSLQSISKNPLDISGLTLQMAITGIDQPTLSAMAARPADADNPSQAINQLTALVRAGFQIKLSSLMLQTTAGRLTVQGSLTYPHQTDHSLSLSALAQHAQLDLTAGIPTEWLHQRISQWLTTHTQAHRHLSGSEHLSTDQVATSMINLWHQKGWLNTQGDIVTTRLQYAHGEARLNGQPIHGATQPQPTASTVTTPSLSTHTHPKQTLTS